MHSKTTPVSGADKEAAKMGCDSQQMKLLAQQTLGKIEDIIAHSSTTTDKTNTDLFSLLVHCTHSLGGMSKSVVESKTLSYRVSTKVLLLHINLRAATTIATNLVSRYSKMTMNYTVKSVTAPPAANNGERSYLDNGTRCGKKVSYKIVERLRFSKKRP
ncbi:hypothetical protein AVEN_105184-1 [Araneus ventricosus]|uniref:Uncharacterized protein n=1 Tax=Araneus ventricosus TaxID=182803 RepID=A0A4Y2TAK3_ARAVE|nr:hypothetical protein AVEN_105184-1 [Araneus ventricosus]